MNIAGKGPLALIILDGWGFSPRTEGNAIALAHTPNYDEICRRYPRTTLAASGTRVGLPENAAGNAEAGHLNIGAGRIVRTDVSRISAAIRHGEFMKNETLKAALGRAAARSASVHLVGLVSDGGVHSSPDSLFALLRMAKKEGLSDVFVHAILDGRDVQPRTADVYIEALEIKMADIGVGRVASLCGRYFAMDSSRNWERTARAYTMMVHSEGERTFDPRTAIRSSFLRGIADEFIAPVVVEKEPGVPVAAIKDGDCVIFFNHRPDTMRQLVQALAVPGASEFAMSGRPAVEVVCLTEYDRGFDLPVAFRTTAEKNVLAEVFARHEIPNIRITESERAPHITYFFNGGTEIELPTEERLLLASGKPDRFETEPELESFRIADGVRRGIRSFKDRVFIVNIPAPGLVAGTGSLGKTIESIQYVDTCLGGIIERVRAANGVAIVTSTHGNCEEMLDAGSGDPNAGVTENPVPFHLVDDRAAGITLREGGALEDVAPTILGILGIPVPEEMTGSDLRSMTPQNH